MRPIAWSSSPVDGMEYTTRPQGSLETGRCDTIFTAAGSNSETGTRELG